MLVAVSGSQGSGKTTILKKLHERGHITVNRKTSRSILTDWGVTLQEVNNNSDLTIKFQDEITNRKSADEQKAGLDKSRIYFTERTHADLFAYSLVTLGKDNDYNDWLNTYYEKCMKLNQQYDLVFYLRAGHFSVEKDGVRGDNPHYSRMVDLAMLDITQQMFHPSILNVIETSNLEQRLNIITLQSTKIWSQYGENI